MLAIIGFIVLVLIGAFLLVWTGAMWFGSAIFGGKAYEIIVPLVLSVAVLWLAFHFAPFTITFTG